MQRIWIALSLLSLCTSAQAQIGKGPIESILEYARPPVAIVVGPKVAEPGDEIIFDASTSEESPTLFRWTVTPEIKGKKQLTLLDGGKRLRLASYPGVYEVRLMVANKHGIDDHSVRIVVTNVVLPPNVEPVTPQPVPNPAPPVPNPGPIVPPNPVPVPTPVVPVAPALPAGDFGGLPQAVLDLANTVQSPSRAAEAATLAGALEGLAAKIVAAKPAMGTLGIVNAVGEAFNGSVPAAWDAGFRAKAIAKMKLLFEGGKLSTPDAWAKMLREVAMGLRAVK